MESKILFTKYKVVQYKQPSYTASLSEYPPELIPYLKEFGSDHPEQRRTAFIMMRFGVSRSYDKILKVIRDTLAEYGIKALRGDDKIYDDSLMTNLRTYLYGCGFGIAVFDRIEADTYNLNVIFESAYMMALGKRVCLLKDKAIIRLPSDMQGLLYTEFDMDDIGDSIRTSLKRWLRQVGLA